jgi:hypothetical protein
MEEAMQNEADVFSVVPVNDGWQVRNVRWPPVRFSTKEAAESYAKSLALQYAPARIETLDLNGEVESWSRYK